MCACVCVCVCVWGGGGDGGDGGGGPGLKHITAVRELNLHLKGQGFRGYFHSSTT